MTEKTLKHKTETHLRQFPSDESIKKILELTASFDKREGYKTWWGKDTEIDTTESLAESIRIILKPEVEQALSLQQEKAEQAVTALAKTVADKIIRIRNWEEKLSRLEKERDDCKKAVANYGKVQYEEGYKSGELFSTEKIKSLEAENSKLKDELEVGSRVKEGEQMTEKFGIAPSVKMLEENHEQLDKFPIEVKCAKCDCDCRINKASQETLNRFGVKILLCEKCGEAEMKNYMGPSAGYGG